MIPVWIKTRFNRVEVIEDRRRPTHRRTIVMSMIAAGFVSIFFGYANDHDACERIQDDRRSSAELLEERSDRTLGNPEKGIPPADFSKPPYDSFRPFKKLIIRNAEADRARALDFRKRISNESCGIL